MIEPRSRALLAPMSGITDLPFRRIAHRMGAGLVVAEMVTDRQLAVEDKTTLHRISCAEDINPNIIQITGRDLELMADAARIAADFGADMVDINMGCPARKVTKGLAGSALMKEPDLALGIIDAVIGAVDVPVSLKMRLGWDDETLNAPLIARDAEQAGVQMFFVHGRTRNQFYKGKADWLRIREVVEAVDKPVFANGDICSFEAARICLHQSQAHGVMIGRGAQGRPWFIGQVGQMLAGESVQPSPSIKARGEIVLAHFEDMLSHYGSYLGVRNARKHLGWYIGALPLDASGAEKAATWRQLLMQEEQPATIIRHIKTLFAALDSSFEAAS